MEYWAEAQKTIINSDINTEIELPIKIIRNNAIEILCIFLIFLFILMIYKR